MATDGVVDQYVEQLLPAKLALDRVYLKRPTIVYDLRILLRTIAGIAARVTGAKRFPEPPELREASMPRLSSSSEAPARHS
jgi:hypothetical protein